MTTTTTRKDTPCLFNAEMIRALLRETSPKDQSRRPIDRVAGYGKVTQFGPSDTPSYDFRFRCKRGLWQELRLQELLKLAPLGQPGDLIWARETFADHGPFVPAEIRSQNRLDHLLYAATDARPAEIKWTPSIHMPKWAARLWLEITGLRVERVRDISEEDAIAEGVTSVAEFRELWISLYGEESWERDWVWVYEFKRVDH